MSDGAEERFAGVSRKIDEEHATTKAAIEEKVTKSREKAAASLK